jgi:D-sedoheptulose 7-phosphate isomerase
MDLDQHIIELFHSSIDTSMRTLDEQSGRVSHCGQLMAQCLLSEKKILCGGEGISGALAQIFCSHMLNRFDYERPSLPVINLSVDATTLTALTSDYGFNNIFSNQIRALGQEGDLLFIIANNTSSTTVLQAIKAAQEREMVVICLSDELNNDFSAILTPEDIEITIPSTNRARISETQLQLINYLSELIDQQLFGSHHHSE